MANYTLTAQKKSDLLAVFAGGKGYWTFDMAIDRQSINAKLDAAGDTDDISFTEREVKTICDALKSARISPNATESELDRYSTLCSEFDAL